MGSRRTAYHADERDGHPFPRRLNFGGCWTGWLTHSEYDIIDMHVRLGVTSISHLNSKKKTIEKLERLHREMRHIGLLTGTPKHFGVTDIALELYRKTDAFLLAGGAWGDENGFETTGT